MDYKLSQPHLGRIHKVNALFDMGNRIIIYTARGDLSGIDQKLLTEAQLQEWGVRYHELRMGKPFADHYIDDKAIVDTDFFEDGGEED